MTTFTKRSLATAAVTGLVVVGGASTAHADDDRQEQRQESILGGPIELGGLNIGSQQDRSSSSSSSSTDTDAPGGSGTESSSTTEDSSSGAGLGVGGLTIDPRGAFSNNSSSTSEDDGEDTDSQRETDLAGSLGIELEGVRGSFGQDTSSSGSSASVDSDEGGTEADRSASQEERSLAGGFDTGGIELRPGASLSDADSSSSDDDGEDRFDQRRSVLDLGAPFSYDGGSYVLDFFSSTEEQEQEAQVDEDGTESEQSSTSDQQSRSFGGELEGGQGDPRLQLDSEDLRLQDR